VGALLAIILSAGFPPSDDGGGCESWTATRAGELAAAPQPDAAPLGVEVSGLAELADRIWASFLPAVPSYTEQNGERFAAALDGRAPMSTAPELVEAARRLEAELGKLLVAARGSQNRLPVSFQIWSVLDRQNPSPSEMDLQAGVRLSLARGWGALQGHNLPRAIEACTGLLGLLRASAGTSVLGRMVSSAWSRRTRDLCLETARRATSSQRDELLLAITRLRSGWPSLAHTLGQELVFAQVALFTSYWSPENRSRLPKEALHLSQAGAKKGEASWLRSFRRALFGRWSAREQCLLYARALPLVDSAPQVADPALGNMDEVPFIGRLADWDELRDSPDHWVKLFRRARALETDLALLRAGLTVWGFHDKSGAWPCSLSVVGDFADARTGRALVLDARGGSIALVAEGDPAHGAQEIRVQLAERD
jgi:hypothetical protein